jgi:type II secretory pathway pseudopilin PulG
MKPSIHSNPSDRTPAVPDKHERAFTLTDLLVVMATLAILAVLIFPALAKSGDGGSRTVCLNNLRQLGTALNMYVAEHQDYLPWPNWGNNPPPCSAGWLYGPTDANHPNDLHSATPAQWATLRDDNLKTGVYWQYIQNPDIFICPVFAANVVGTARWATYPNKLSSYCMNGASCFYPPLGNVSVYQYRTCKASQIWSPSCIIQWEPSGTSGTDNGYNDGANYPNLDEGPSTVLHVTGVNVLAVGGSTRVMSFGDVLGEFNSPPMNVHTRGRGLFYWNPITDNGH